jgi:hypothetical protein
MRLATGFYIYLVVVASGILANFVLWRYRLHLYDLNSDYSREPLQSVQMVLFRGTEGFIVAGLLLLAWWKFAGRKD